MLFPVSYSETIVLKKKKYHASAKSSVHSILTGLNKQNVSKVNNIANSIYFKSGFGFFDLWGILSTLRSGTILVQEGKGEIYVTYNLKFNKFIIYLTALAALLLSILLMTQMSNEFVKVATHLLFAWLLLFSGSYLLTICCFPLFIKRTITSEI